jgi:hypothetical protein
MRELNSKALKAGVKQSVIDQGENRAIRLLQNS